MPPIVTRDDFRTRLQPLTRIERELLEQSLKLDGCKDPLIVWPVNGEYVLVDGHNRFDICSRLGLSYGVEELAFGSAREAIEWIDANQLARRNLSDEQRTLVLGRIYNARKKRAGNPALQSPNVVKLTTLESVKKKKGKTKGQAALRGKQSKPKTSGATAKEIAVEQGVSEKSVRRAGTRAKVHDAFDSAGLAEAASLAKKASQAAVDAAASCLPRETPPNKDELYRAQTNLFETATNRPPKNPASTTKPSGMIPFAESDSVATITQSLLAQVAYLSDNKLVDVCAAFADSAEIKNRKIGSRIATSVAMAASKDELRDAVDFLQIWGDDESPHSTDLAAAPADNFSDIPF